MDMRYEDGAAITDVIEKAGTPAFWTPDGWHNRPIRQAPTYPDAARLDTAERKLRRYPPFVFAGEARRLAAELASTAEGEAFVLLGGDCAESFEEFTADILRDTFRVLLQMAVVLTFGAAHGGDAVRRRAIERESVSARRWGMMADRAVLLGLIGAPIAHSASPSMYDAAGRATGFRVHYQLVEVYGADRDRLHVLLEGVRLIGFAGVNVTFPYKEAVLPLLDAIDPQAAEIGAVNAIAVRDGRLVGYNTDTTGFARAVIEEVGPLDGPVVLIGAGGVGRAAAFALARLGVPELRIFDSQPRKARQLASDLGGRAPAEAFGALAQALAVAVGVVNGTPVGMLPDRGIPLPPELLHAGLWVADVVYHPLVTPLLQAARACGARIITGRALTVYHAVDAFELFTGTRLPVAPM